MSRQMLDTAIVVAVLVLAGTQLYAQLFGSRKVAHPNPAAGTTVSAARVIKGPNGGAAVGGHSAATDRLSRAK